MRMENDFVDMFGPPLAASGSASIAVRLGEQESGRHLLAAISPGSYDHGFFSVASVRENAGDLGAWSTWFPAGAFLFATSVFGMLYVAVGDRMWLANAPYGSILPTDFALDKAVARVARASTRDDLLQRPLFEQWRSGSGVLRPDELLALATPVSEGGKWEVANFVVTPIDRYLEQSATPFEPLGSIPISMMRP